MWMFSTWIWLSWGYMYILQEKIHIGMTLMSGLLPSIKWKVYTLPPQVDKLLGEGEIVDEWL